MHPFSTLAGWQLAHDRDAGTVDVLDPTGVSRARVTGTGRRRHPRRRETLPVLLPDGRRTTLTNGTRWWGTRRARTRGLLPLGGVQYVLQHRTSRRARLLRDGAWLATLVRDAPTPRVELRSGLTPDDQLAAAVLGLVLQPGRGSVLGGVAELFGSGV